MRKIFSLFLSLMAIIQVSAQVSWSYDEASKTLTISGNGPMADYSQTSLNGSNVTSAPWGNKASDVKSVVIANGVTSIGSYAFYGCHRLTSVTIPSSVTSIGVKALYFCRLRRIDVLAEVPPSVRDSFPASGSIIVPDGTIEAYKDAWNLNYGLIEANDAAEVSVYVETPGDLARLIYAQKKLSKVYSLKVSGFLNSDDITTIKEQLPSLRFVDMTGVDAATLSDLSFGFPSTVCTVSLPQGLTKIPNYAFYGCWSVSLVIPDGVQSIGYNACSTDEVELPSSVVSVGSGCNFGIVYYSGSLADWCGIRWNDKSFRSLVIDGTPLAGDVTIPDGVTTVKSYSFSNLKDVTSITIGNDVTTIENSAFEGTSIKSITIGKNVTSIGSGAINLSSLESIACKGAVPPTLGAALSNVNKKTCKLYIPEGAEFDYATALYWSDFDNIIESEEAGSTLKDNYDLKVTVTPGGTVTCGGSIVSATTTMPVVSGASKTFSIQPNDGYRIARVVYGGKDVTAQVLSSGSFTTGAITASATLSIVFAVDAYRIEMYVASTGARFVSRVKPGQAFLGSVEETGEAVVTKVTLDGADVTATALGEDGLISLTNVTSDHVIIAYVSAGSSTDLKALSADADITAWRAASTVFVEATADVELVEVIDLSGRVVATATPSGYGVLTFGVGQGIHIVRATMASGAIATRKL